MPIPVCYCQGIAPGDTLWVSLLPGRDPVRVTVEHVTIFRDDAGSAVNATLHVRTVMGNVIPITAHDIVRRTT